MKQQEQSDGVDKEYAVSVGGLASGYYIVVMQTTGGKMYRSKFMKR